MSGHGSREWQTVMGATLGPLLLLCKLHVPCRSWIVNCHNGKWSIEMVIGRLSKALPWRRNHRNCSLFTN